MAAGHPAAIVLTGHIRKSRTELCGRMIFGCSLQRFAYDRHGDQ